MDEQDEQLPSRTVYLSNRNEEDGSCLYRAAQPPEATLAVTQVPSFCHPWQVAAVANGTKFLFHPGWCADSSVRTAWIWKGRGLEADRQY